ncbi:hypothetical protein ND446_04905 [Yersinia ruckeri]|uniref:hypothetical protein n=1 Tax=Yersinia ruckeri TaxID=29486 RepID=UPI002264BE68|nr:hypothetical protein [Yersinia ruckeri]UZX56253.1 hypothetical protein ND446_04905 [Yersinia ruckeri]
MIGLVVIIICLALSIFCYKKMANRCRVKERGKLTTFFISLSSSSFVFIVSMIIGVANFFPEAKSNKSLNTKDTISKYDCTLTYLGVIPGSKESWQTPAILTVTNNDFSISFIDPEDGGDGLVRSQPLGGTICDDENICTRKGESEDTQESKISKTKIRSILKISDSPTAVNILTSLDTMMITHAVNECHKKQ